MAYLERRVEYWGINESFNPYKIVIYKYKLTYLMVKEHRFGIIKIPLPIIYRVFKSKSEIQATPTSRKCTNNARIEYLYLHNYQEYIVLPVK